MSRPSPLLNNLLNIETPGKHIESKVAQRTTQFLQSCDRRVLVFFRQFDTSPASKPMCACDYVAI
jgi:hypothetical protein